MITLRPYPKESIECVRDLVRKGTRRTLLVVATGAGKTTRAGQIISEAARGGARSMFLAHRGELIDQAYHRLRLQRHGD